ncbi:hypothetical protein HY798_00400, partial [Candidatus Falkowbacteria bacterium]|nr:hypothetical protein [Candidatus Falkowbacteria bacterium]
MTGETNNKMAKYLNASRFVVDLKKSYRSASPRYPADGGTAHPNSVFSLGEIIKRNFFGFFSKLRFKLPDLT